MFAALCATATASAASSSPKAMPGHDHVFVIVAENKNYDQVVGQQSQAPNLARLATTYGLASNFYGEAHPSQGNYIAMVCKSI